MTNPTDQFYLTPDATKIIDRRTGASWSTREAARILFAKDQPMTPFMRRTLAHDQVFQERDDPSKTPDYNQNQDQEPGEAEANGASCIDSASCLVFVQKLLEGLDDVERGKFIEGLSNLVNGGGDGELEILHRPNGNGGNGMPRGATDRRLRRRPVAQDAALQSLNSSAFNRRWGKLTAGVSMNGAGR